MGKLEERLSKKIRNTKIQNAILQTVALTGVLAVAVLAPNALQMLKSLNILKNKGDKKLHRTIYESRERLIKKGLIKRDGKYLSLTKNGQETIDRLEKFDYKIEKPKKWDNKWRIVIFDIKEYKRGYRDNLRRVLAQIGFLKLQNSVWAYPYDCEDLFNLIKTDFKMDKEILYIIADQIEHDYVIKKHFGLV